MLTDLLRAQSRTRPDDIAASCLGIQLSYSTLVARANAFARLLASHGMAPGDRVALVVPKSIDALVALVGASLAGCAFVPIDPRIPPRRLARVLLDCEPEALVATAATVDRVCQVDSAILQACRIVVTNERSAARNESLHDFTASATHFESPSGISDDRPAYLLYTSGTTGEPKGVVHSHRSATAFVDWAIRSFDIGPGKRLANCAQWSFDLSIFDIWAALSGGAQVELVPMETMLRPQELVRNLRTWRSTHFYAVPSTISMLESDGGLRDSPLEHLQHVLYAGEPFLISRLRSVMHCLPRSRFHNLFGPTETNVCTHYAIPAMPHESASHIPIGQACDHLAVELLDDDGRPVASGTEGELCVAGPSVLTEYFRRPDETRNAFFDAALFSDGRSRYRTGDRASLDADGLFWFRGRRDRLIKRRGYRIELGEIEAVLGLDASVLEAAAFSIRSGADMLLAAAVSLKRGACETPLKLKMHCGKLLPPYMVPDSIQIWVELPRTPNGKVDLQRLANASAV